MKIEY